MGLRLGLSLASADGAADPPPAAAHTAADVANAADALPAAATDAAPGTRRSGRLLLGNLQYWVYACCYACLAGIGFAIPSAQVRVRGRGRGRVRVRVRIRIRRSLCRAASPPEP